VLVPGNEEIGTSDFYVMEYEAKKGSDNKPVSQAASAPWTRINLEAAKTACESLGPGYHLITNAEWTTLARDIESTPASWTGGSVGSGMIKRGNAGTVDAGTYDGSDPEYGTSRNTKAELTLSNGNTIWDLSGNVNEWVDGTCTPGTGNNFWSATSSYEWTDTILTDFERSEAGPSTSVSYGTTTRAKGTGIYGGCGYDDNDYVTYDGTDYYFYYGIYRGGAYDWGTSSGIFYMTSYDATCSYSTGIGFRCAKSLDCDASTCYSYSWYTGEWSGSSGTRTRTVYCERSDGTQVADSYCAGSKPPSSQAFWSGSGCASCPYGWSQMGSDTTYKYCNLNGKEGTFKTKYPQYDDWRAYSYVTASTKCCCSRLSTNGPLENTLWKIID
jgi:hypothetical protein